MRKDREWPEVTEAPAWCLYLDDSTILRKVQAEVAIRLAGKAQQEQERLRRAYAFWGIPYNSKKAIEECECAGRLGAFLDGKAGRIGVTVRRYLESLSLGLWVLQSRFVSRKALQVFAGKEVHCLQFRRPLFSVYDEIWKLIAGPSDFPQVTPRLILEVLISLGLGPMRFTDWRAKIDPKVMASDASERGGGFVMANRITALGKNALEQDKACRRLIRRTWPGGSEYSDIRKLTESCLVAAKDYLSCRVNVGILLTSVQLSFMILLTGFRIWSWFASEGESPSLVSSRMLWWMKVTGMTSLTSWVRIETSDISRVRRPRLYWISEDIPDMPWFEVMRTDVASRVKMYGEVEPTPLWLPWVWMALWGSRSQVPNIHKANTPEETSTRPCRVSNIISRGLGKVGGG